MPRKSAVSRAPGAARVSGLAGSELLARSDAAVAAQASAEAQRHAIARKVFEQLGRGSAVVALIKVRGRPYVGCVSERTTLKLEHEHVPVGRYTATAQFAHVLADLEAVGL